MADAATRHGVHLVVGVIERDGDTLYCSVFFYSPEKYLGKHRKILPTAMERCIWGQGDGSTMPVSLLSSSDVIHSRCSRRTWGGSAARFVGSPTFR